MANALNDALAGAVAAGASGADRVAILSDVGGGISLNASTIAGRGSAGGAGAIEEITLGTNLSMSGTTLNATGGGGSGDINALLLMGG